MPPMDPKTLLMRNGDDMLRAGMRAFEPNQQPGAPSVAKRAQGVNQGVQHRGAPVTDPSDVATAATLAAADNVFSKMAMAGFMAPMGMGAVAAGAEKAAKWTGATSLNTVSGALKGVSETTFESVPILGSLAQGATRVAMGGVGLITGALEKTGFTGWRTAANTAKFDKHSATLAQKAESFFGQGVASAELRTAMNGLQAHMLAHPSAFNAEAFETELKTFSELAGRQQPKLVKEFGKLRGVMEKAHGSHYMADAWSNLSHYAKAAPQKVAKASVFHGALNTGIMGGVAVSAAKTGLDLRTSLRTLKAMYADQTGKSPDSVSSMTLLFSKDLPKAVLQARGQLWKEFGPSLLMEAGNIGVNVDMVMRNRGGMMAMIPLMVFGMGSQMVRSVLGSSLIPAYKQAKEMEAAGAPIPPEVYATLVGEGEPQLAKRGGADSNFAHALGEMYARENAGVQQVMHDIQNGGVSARIEQLKAEYIAATQQPEQQPAGVKAQPQEQTQTPIQTQAHDDAQISAQAQELLDAAMSKVNMPDPLAAPEVSHVDRLHNKSHTAPREVLGKHTQHLAHSHATHENGAEPNLSV